MKLISNDYNEEFMPFDITLRVETLGEARLLWHVFNRGDLKKEIFKNYNNDYLYNDCDNNFGDCFAIMNYIENKIKPEVI